ncbi:hypothetical protein EDC94DRAFT_501922, partial [Helicostylum pulchrum]
MPMDNVPIYSPGAADPIILERGYIPLYVPPYLPERNPIEIFCKVSKDRIRRSELIDAETLSSRVI